MRKLLWFTLGFTASLGLCTGVLWQADLIAAMAAAAVPVLLFWLLSRKIRLFRIFVPISLGVLLGLGWFAGFRSGLPAAAGALDGQTVSVRLRVSDYGHASLRGTAAEGTLMLGDRPCKVRLYLNEERTLDPGTVLEGPFRFRLTTPGGKQQATWHSGRGIYLLAYQAGELTADREEDLWQDWPALARNRIRDTLNRRFPPDTAGFAAALLLGDSSGLSEDRILDLQRSGIRHLVAVSGLHVAILFGFVRVLTFKKTWLTAIIGTAVLLLFAAVAGFTPSVTRAALMLILMMLAQALGREYDPLTALGFSCLLMELHNPLVITSISFQLSAASVLGILLFGQPIYLWLENRFPVDRKHRRRKKLLTGIWAGLSVSLSAMILVTPLCARYFGAVSLVSVLTNFLTVWLVGFLFYGILLVCILDLFWAWAAGVLGWITAWGIRYVLLCARFCGALPLSAVYTASPYVVFWLIFSYLLLGVFLIQKKKRPAVLLSCGTLGLCLALLCSWTEPLLDPVRMTVFDVGQGQCILLQSQGRSLLVDCGGDRDKEAGVLAAETLLSQGVRRIDGVILTHFDRDHVGGLPQFLSRVEADFLLIPDTDQPLPEALPLPVETLAFPAEMDFGSCRIRIFPGVSGSTANEKGLCVLLESETCDILITGDRSEFGERLLLRQYAIPPVDYLMAGHHGAADSTCRELLEAVHPDTVIISSGTDNPYGHPAPETLERLRQFGCTVLRTDQCGTIIIRR